jgi:hypothetical protein
MPLAAPYQILDVRRNASAERIDKAFRKLARWHYPDRGSLQQVPDSPATCYRKQPKPAVVALAMQEFEHWARIGGRQPIVFGHKMTCGVSRTAP